MVHNLINARRPPAADSVASFVGIDKTVVIGAEGMHFGRDLETNAVVIMKHMGNVIIEKNVAIEAYSTIVRGVLDSTIISSGVRMGCQCHIGHNVHVGCDTFMVAPPRVFITHARRWRFAITTPVKKRWAHLDLNQGPTGYEPVALTRLSYGPKLCLTSKKCYPQVSRGLSRFKMWAGPSGRASGVALNTFPVGIAAYRGRDISPRGEDAPSTPHTLPVPHVNNGLV